jgi:hypothetical protein
LLITPYTGGVTPSTMRSAQSIMSWRPTSISAASAAARETGAPSKEL